MVTIKVSYEGDLHCRLTHGPSGQEFLTDAPVDNMGKGEFFSPTDLMAAAVGSCMLTIMGIYAARHGIDLRGARAEVTKEMVQEPVRRIGKLAVVFHMPRRIDPRHREALERAALTCPVHKSLHPDIEAPVRFEYV